MRTRPYHELRRSCLMKDMYASVARQNDALLLPVEQGHEVYRRELLEQARIRRQMEGWR